MRFFMKKLFIAVLLLAMFSPVISDASTMFTRRHRVGLNIGAMVPLGLKYEYLLPAAKDRLALEAEFNFFNYGYGAFTVGTTGQIPDATTEVYSADLSLGLSSWNIGVKYYLMGRHEGMYFGLGVGQFTINPVADNLKGFVLINSSDSETDEIQALFTEGELSVNESIFAFRPRLGGTWIWDSGFMMGFEAGWTVLFFDDTIEFDVEGQANIDGKSQKVNETKSVDLTEAMPIQIKGVPRLYLTFGWAF
jgi:hypothetical protein